jgi:hypothetical protein
VISSGIKEFPYAYPATTSRHNFVIFEAIKQVVHQVIKVVGHSVFAVVFHATRRRNRAFFRLERH